MFLITEHYVEQQKALHAAGSYGVTAPRHLNAILDSARFYQAQTVLDYGSGTKKWCERFFFERPAITVRSYDPAVPGIDGEPEPADLLVCIDVMEHIETQCLRNVLQHTKLLATKGAYFSIATRPAKKSLPDGRNAHLIVESGEWWLNHMMTYFVIRRYEDRGVDCIIEGNPR